MRSLPDRSLIDRLVRSRGWIPVLGVLLAGLVAMQVEILKLGTTTGHSLERSSALQTQNDWLQTRVATLADDQRIERLAASMGMIIPTPTAVSFLSSRAGGAVGRAVGNLRAPDPSAFTAQLAVQAAAAAALAPPAPASSSAASPAPAGSGTQSATAGTTAPTSSGTAGGPAAPGTSPAASGAPASPPSPSPATPSAAATPAGGGALGTGAAAPAGPPSASSAAQPGG